MSNVIGIDISLTSTGIATAAGTTVSKGGKGDDRLFRLYEGVAAACTMHYIDLAVIEDLPINAMSAGLTGMAQGVVRMALARNRIPVVRIPPASLKMYATGKGNADKADMRKAACLHDEWASERNDDEVDAWWLRDAGLSMLDGYGGFGHTDALTRLNKKGKPVIDWSPWKDWLE